MIAFASVGSYHEAAIDRSPGFEPENRPRSRRRPRPRSVRVCIAQCCRTSADSIALGGIPHPGHAEHAGLAVEDEDDNEDDYDALACFVDFRSIFGKKTVNSPIRGKKAQSWNTNRMLVRSMSCPSTADPIPPSPKAKPKKRPETRPTFPGINY